VHLDRFGAETSDRERPTGADPPPADHHDVLPRRLWDLGELHRDGVLTDEESVDDEGFGAGGF
jgi:hypothetical protein